ncbi:MAG: GNAT family N-acetyltransferase [Proteobacteria bacterium]|nr:GNAT family N-acetyltransferase [Pseudomonadota bacterium]
MERNRIDIKIGHQKLPFNQILELYNSLKWFVYTKGEQKEKLLQAIQNSSYVVTAWDEEKLIGLARCLSDDVSIFYLQDILIKPEYQRQGIGSELLSKCLERYEHVRTKVLLTGAQVHQKLFYESFGYKNTKDFSNIELNAFVQIKGVELE